MAGEVASGSQRIKRERDDQVITANYKIQDLTIEDAKEDTSYNAFAATLPAHAAFDKDLDVITGKAAALVEEVSEILKKHAGDSTVLKNMLARATDAMGTPKVEPPMIALLGDTGDGRLSHDSLATVC